MEHNSFRMTPSRLCKGGDIDFPSSTTRMRRDPHNLWTTNQLQPICWTLKPSCLPLQKACFSKYGKGLASFMPKKKAQHHNSQCQAFPLFTTSYPPIAAVKRWVVTRKRGFIFTLMIYIDTQQRWKVPAPWKGSLSYRKRNFCQEKSFTKLDFHGQDEIQFKRP